jgi:MFS family permease
MALAFVMVGAGLGAMILPVVAQSIITRSGWRTAYLALGCIALLLGLPLSWRYVRERGPIQNPAVRVEHSGKTWQQGLQALPFWIIVAVLCVSSISMNGAITQMSALLTDRGITARQAALCASMLGGSSLFGRIVVGWLLDRFFGARVALLVNLVTAAGVFLLARASSFSAGCVAAALIGIGAGGEAAITPYLLTRYFGLRVPLYGLWSFCCFRSGRPGGPRLRFNRSYSSLLVALAAALAVAAAMNLLLPVIPQVHQLLDRKVPGPLATPAVVTATLPVFAAAGTVAVTCVSEFTVNIVAFTPPKLTAVACFRLMPVITTCAPTLPALGLKPETVGKTLYVWGDSRLPPGSSTVTGPVVAPATTFAVMNVSLAATNVPAPAPNFTPVAFEKPCPRMFTDAPTFPDQITKTEANAFR